MKSSAFGGDACNVYNVRRHQFAGERREGTMSSKRFLFADVDGFVSDVVRISGTLSNLNYLIELDARNPGLVQQYAKQSERLLQALEGLVHSADAQVCESSCS